ncbi:Fpg/Nei family DNA glycosylase [Streptomyces goshikiensis]
MPELPEVEALREFLDEHLTGRVVERVHPLAVSVLKTYEPPLTALEGQPAGTTARHGKFLALRIGELHLVTHLARAGWLRWQGLLPRAAPAPRQGPARAAPRTGGRRRLRPHRGGNAKKRLAVYVVRDPQEVPGIARLGPDPLADAFDRDAFAALLAGERRQIKGVLRDQGVIAGIGNAYSDEILHRAKVSPFKLAASFDEEQVTHLYGAVQDTLREAVARSHGVAAGRLKAEKKSAMRVHGREGEPCPVCGDTVRSVSFADSSLQYCPTCQTGGKPLADRRLSRLLK